MCLNLCCTSIHIPLMKLLLRDGALTSTVTKVPNVMFSHWIYDVLLYLALFEYHFHVRIGKINQI